MGTLLTSGARWCNNFLFDSSFLIVITAHVDVALPSVRIVCIDLIGAPAGNRESGLGRKGRKAYQASKLFLKASVQNLFLAYACSAGVAESH